MSPKMLICQVHKRPDSSLPAGLISAIIGRIEVGNLLTVHDGFHNRRGNGAWHAGKRVYVYHAVISFVHIFHNPGNAQTRLCAQLKGIEITLYKGFFQVTHPMLPSQVK